MNSQNLFLKVHVKIEWNTCQGKLVNEKQIHRLMFPIDSPKFIELYMEMLHWWPTGRVTIWWPETNRKICRWVLLLAVRNIPKFQDRANWSRDTFQPMRRRACVYQQTNQNIAPVIKNFQNNGRSRTESVIVSRFSGIFLRLFMRHTQFF